MGPRCIEASSSALLDSWELPLLPAGGDLSLHHALGLAHSDLCDDATSLRRSDDAISTARARCAESRGHYWDLLQLYANSVERRFDDAFFRSQVGKLRAVRGHVFMLGESDTEFSDWEGVSVEGPMSEA